MNGIEWGMFASALVGCLVFPWVIVLPWFGDQDFFKLNTRLKNIYLGALIGIPGLVLSLVALIVLCCLHRS